MTTRTIASWEMRGAARSRWLLGAGLLYAAGAVALTLVGLRSLRELGLAGAGAASEGLIALGVLLPPLVGLLSGAAAVAGARDTGTLALVAAQPIRRSALAWGMVTGLSASLWVAIVVGLGLVAVILAPVASMSDLPGLAAAALAALAAAIIGVALGVMISALSSTRSQATAIAAAVWFATALGLDLLLAAVAPGLRFGPGTLLWAVVANPLESVRLLALLIADESALGAFGTYLFDRFGRLGAAGILGTATAAWVVIPTVIAGTALKRRDI